MPTRQELIARVQSALGTSLSPSMATSAAASDLYEIYVLSIAIRAARTEGATVRFELSDGTVASTLTFRKSPGHIWSRAHPYSHAVIEFPSKPLLEGHVGIYISGKSGVIHEADLAILRRDEALTCRNSNVPPRHSKIIASVECKFYATTLGLHLARGFMGLCTDLTGRNGRLVTNSESASAERLLTHHQKNWEVRIEPRNALELERLRNSFQTAFRNFKATN